MKPEENDPYYRRLPTALAENVNDGVKYLYRNAAGGRLRFKTDSPYIAVSLKVSSVQTFSHMAATGFAGCDLYAKSEGASEEIYIGTFMPPYKDYDCYEGVIDLPDGKLRTVTVNLPLYINADEIYVGLKEGSAYEECEPYRASILYYGSSITQGACASRPGSCYQAYISRALNCDCVNLGFSGSAKGEDNIADYVAGLTTDLFVYDYAHNAPDPAHLAATHEKMFKKFRATHPDTPVIMVTRPKKHLTADEAERRDIVKRTYENALASGDNNVYFVDGSTFFEDFYAECCLVDNCHPTDLGFMYMAKKLIPIIENALHLMNNA